MIIKLKMEWVLKCIMIEIIINRMFIYMINLVFIYMINVVSLYKVIYWLIMNMSLLMRLNNKLTKFKK